jgi:hypothetical protein
MWVPYAALSNTYRALESRGLSVKYVPQSREKTYLHMGGYTWVQTPRSPSALRLGAVTWIAVVVFSLVGG